MAKKTDKKPAAPKINLTRKRKILAVATLIAVAILLYLGRGLFVAATVNGQPISRLAVIKELEKQGGGQVLDSIVSKLLVIQEGGKQKITIPKEDIDNEIKKYEDTLKAQNQTLDQALASQGVTLDYVKEQIKLQKLVEKMVLADVNVTKDEVSQYITTNKLAKAATQTQEDFEKGIEAQLKQQKSSEKVQTWLTDLRKNAKINYFVSY